MARLGFRKRYIAFKVISEEQHNKQAIFDAISKSILTLRGSHRPNKINLRLLEYDQQSGQGILVCGHKLVDLVRQSISTGIKIADKPATIRVIGVSGTIRRLYQKFLS
jgi:ribonuclease P/MRP protein subunit POP5